MSITVRGIQRGQAKSLDWQCPRQCRLIGQGPPQDLAAKPGDLFAGMVAAAKLKAGAGEH